MKLISWNCQGLGRPSAARALQDIVKTIDPVEIFLMETKIDYSFVAHVMNKLGLLIFFLYLCSLKIIFIWR